MTSPGAGLRPQIGRDSSLLFLQLPPLHTSGLFLTDGAIGIFPAPSTLSLTRPGDRAAGTPSSGLH